MICKKTRKLLSLILVPLAFNAVAFLPAREFNVKPALEVSISQTTQKLGKSQESAVLPQRNDFKPSPEDIKTYIKTQSLKAGVNPNIPLFIAEKESKFNPLAIGDNNHSRGLFQISDIYHPEVSDACAFDYKCATKWAVKYMLAGNLTEWSTWKYRNEWFTDAIN